MLYINGLRMKWCSMPDHGESNDMHLPCPSSCLISKWPKAFAWWYWHQVLMACQSGKCWFCLSARLWNYHVRLLSASSYPASGQAHINQTRAPAQVITAEAAQVTGQSGSVVALRPGGHDRPGRKSEPLAECSASGWHFQAWL